MGVFSRTTFFSFWLLLAREFLVSFDGRGKSAAIQEPFSYHSFFLFILFFNFLNFFFFGKKISGGESVCGIRREHTHREICSGAWAGRVQSTNQHVAFNAQSTIDIVTFVERVRENDCDQWPGPPTRQIFHEKRNRRNTEKFKSKRMDSHWWAVGGFCF